MMRLSWNISESQSAPRHLAISLQPALTGADPVCCREYLGWWTELCSTDPSQIAHFSNVIFVNSVTWALGVAILGRQAAVLLISYFTVFSLSNWPPVYLCVGSSPFSSRMPSIWNERSGIVPGKSSVADGEKTIYTHTAVQYYFMKNEKHPFAISFTHDIAFNVWYIFECASSEVSRLSRWFMSISLKICAHQNLQCRLCTDIC